MEKQQYNERNQELFTQMDKAIREGLLFTKHDISRDIMCKMLDIDRNRFAVMIRDHSGSRNFCGYLNKLRINHAVMLMRKHPNWTLKAIIEGCGMTVTPFKRIFKETFGVPPTAYRKELERMRSAKNNPARRVSNPKGKHWNANEC